VCKGLGEEVIPAGADVYRKLQGKPEQQHTLGQRNWRDQSLHGGERLLRHVLTPLSTETP